MIAKPFTGELSGTDGGGRDGTTKAVLPQPFTLFGHVHSLFPCMFVAQVFKRGGQLLLRLGDTDVPYSDEFRFFVTTKLANPHYMPEICIKVTRYAKRPIPFRFRRIVGMSRTV